MDELITVVEAAKPDVIGITESWGNDDISDSELCIPGFNIFRADRSNGHRGGGVVLLVNSGMGAVEVKLKNDFSDKPGAKSELKMEKNYLLEFVIVRPTPSFLVRIMIRRYVSCWKKYVANLQY